MTIFEAIALLVTALIVPWVVQLIKHGAITGKRAMWLAVGISVLAGIAAGFIGGIPETIGDWVECIFTAVGGVQVAYAAFKTVGVTNKWLNALANVRTPDRNLAEHDEAVRALQAKASAEEVADKAGE